MTSNETGSLIAFLSALHSISGNSDCNTITVHARRQEDVVVVTKEQTKWDDEAKDKVNLVSPSLQQAQLKWDKFCEDEMGCHARSHPKEKREFGPERGRAALSGPNPTFPLGLNFLGGLLVTKQHPVGLGQLGRHNDDRESRAPPWPPLVAR
ncbi:hypothetical protein THAOC_14780 [Thalassiosira oceanica]|uniref:Uncharacterized protein n=1 Tax=Thalassiosira oceanica TaxID=159749 RepID=K0SGH6_THAOC|nr:hypothetical protein THAOC_14780 [Thalassiosira oceanica]|eukprot:EJK64480.1 hypothetical protein THAOC_14780 [Thalassiosira oceanica]